MAPGYLGGPGYQYVAYEITVRVHGGQSAKLAIDNGRASTSLKVQLARRNRGIGSQFESHVTV